MAMEPRRKILLYGNSLILSALNANLQDYPQFQVNILLPPWPRKLRLEEMKPDIIFFDLVAVRPEAAFFLLESCPGLLLIGISPDSNLVKVWSGRQLHELSLRNLLEVIGEQMEANPSTIKEGGVMN
jgi:hypothetical protein